MNTTVKVYVNDKFYRNIIVKGNVVDGKTMYDPRLITNQIFLDKEAGLLNTYVKPDGKMTIRMEQV